MSFLSKERSFLPHTQLKAARKGLLHVTLATAIAAAGCSTSPKNTEASPLPVHIVTQNTASVSTEIDYSSLTITGNNFEEISKEIGKRTKNLPLITFKELPKIGSVEEQENTPRLGKDKQDYLEKYGIKAFYFGQLLNDHRMMHLAVECLPNVQFGNKYLSPNYPQPAFLLHFEPDFEFPLVPLISQPNRLGYDIKSNSSIAIFSFPTVRYGDFIIHFNQGLFVVNGQETPSFSLPYKFLIEN